jgi:hypothetical protein
MLKRLLKTKTFWAAVAALIAATERVATGQSTLTEGLQIAIPALMALLLRDGIAKAASQTNTPPTPTTGAAAPESGE